MVSKGNSKPLIVALDFPSPARAMEFSGCLDPAKCRVKVGKELFTRAGPQLVEELQNAGFEVFLDLKFHDIPNTVAGACRAAAELGVWMLNVHVSGGAAMLLAARDALDKHARPPLLIGVTILTSLAASDLETLGWRTSPQQAVRRLADVAHAHGCDGVVCSAWEAAQLRERLGDGFLLVTPGIRPAHADAGDQRRVATPRTALRAGASYLVLGRPITQAADPRAALAGVLKEIEACGT